MRCLHLPSTAAAVALLGLWVLVPAAAEDNVAPGIAPGRDDTGFPVLVNTQKTVRMPGRFHGINGNLLFIKKTNPKLIITIDKTNNNTLII